MLIKNQSAQREKNYHRITGMVLAGMVLLLGAIWIFQPSHRTNKPSDGAIFCSAEIKKNGRYIEQGIDFGAADNRSDLQARSGQYACRLEAKGETQYGFGYKTGNPDLGKAYKISVWRYAEIPESAFLAVQIKGEEEQYFQTGTPIEKDENGWEKLEIRFFLPFGKKVESLNSYVYSGGQFEAFFDDFLVEMLHPLADTAFQPEVLNLHIKESELAQLRKKREEAFQKGILEADDNDWVEAELEGDSTGVMPVQLRLKGDWLDHLRGDKWSFRIAMDDPYAWRRMQTFSLHTPIARYFLHEWLLHQLWEQEDVLTTRYDFVELRLNGQSLGIYAYEEHFEKHLVEYRERREGPIVKFAEDGYWQALKRQLNHHGFIRPHATHAQMEWENAEVQAFKQKSIQKSPVLSAQYEQAQTLMEQYRQGKLPVSDVFDLKPLARYYAVCDVLNGYHGINWHNQRFYYNPVINKLEPIGFDGYGGPPEAQYTFLGEGALNPYSVMQESAFAPLFSDPEFVRAYVEALYRLSSKSYLREFMDRIYPNWAARLQYLQLEFTDYRPDFDDIYRQAQYIHSILLPYGNYSLEVFNAPGFDYDTRFRQLLLRNRHNLPLEVIGYSLSKAGAVQPLDTTILLAGQIPRRFLSRLRKSGQIDDFGAVRYLEQAAISTQHIPQYESLLVPTKARYLCFRVPGIDSLFYKEIGKNQLPEQRTAVQRLMPQTELKSNNWYQVKGQQIVFKPGKHLIDQPIVIPAGYTVFAEAATTLDFNQGAFLLSYSPLQFFGSEAAPIRITSQDRQGSFTLLGETSPSIFSYVIFEDLNTLKTNGWNLTGAVTCYESEVIFKHCVFRNNHCEDALNLIRSNFTIEDCHFAQIFSDAFDSDFSRGTVTRSAFVNTGNDGMDFSGSIANIKDCYLEGNGDKGISVGEESDVSVFNTSITGAPIALAGKDFSVVVVKALNITDCEQGFVAFQKKPEFGGSYILVESFQVENTKRLYAIAKGSRLQLVDRLIE
ncbi:MAG TPA: CotH kinase family protein [Saprospiraceae bacterium]|nr:CotH kinase family protein [Saprospiraceae bacterium]HMQ82607.1 CotH kinase family protein [Saprospiraceae bacterium]